MQQDDEFEWRYTLQFPSAKIYGVDYILNSILAAMHPCNHHSTVQNTFFTPRWNAVNNNKNEENKAGHKEKKNEICELCSYAKKESKIKLIQRLARKIFQNKIEVWDMFAENVMDIPGDIEILTWATTATIFKSDVVKFCNGERIRVLFDGDVDQSAHIDWNESDKALKKPTQIAGASASITSSHTGNKPPGITRKAILITKYAIEVAWEIECESGIKASATQVITKLKSLVGSEKYPDLIRVVPQGVMWMKSNTDEKKYDLEACRKTLTSWHGRRAKTAPETAPETASETAPRPRLKTLRKPENQLKGNI